MRMSCNGCRVLRKGCSENCTIRPCLDWIKCPHSQAYATVFLAKFYGRAGLINLINSGPPHLRPAIFRSLLYEACGRIVNPVYGSVGLMWSGSWNLCQTAVEEVLNGAPITQIAAENQIGPPLKAYDIRHVNKKDCDLNRVRTRCRFKRAGKKSKPVRVSAGEVDGSPSHESSLSHQSDVNRAKEPGSDSGRRADDGLIELDLGLGLEPFKGHLKPKEIEMKIDVGSAEDEAGFCKMELGLDYTALCDQF